jgi:hypothetical protein
MELCGDGKMEIEWFLKNIKNPFAQVQLNINSIESWQRAAYFSSVKELGHRRSTECLQEMFVGFQLAIRPRSSARQQWKK